MTMGAEKDMPQVNREGEISGGGVRFRFREYGAGDPVIWLGPPERSASLRALVAAQCRVIELAGKAGTAAAIAEAAAALGIERFGVVAEGQDAALALRVALDYPQAVAALALLAPTVINALGQAADEALVSRLGALTPPLLAVFGTRDQLAPPEAGRHYRERLATCNVVFVYDAGHAMGEERPEAVAELVTDFLRRHDLFLVRQESDLLYR
jgi:pimeloyl-ACP methyl ester carboxylesterase